MAWGQSDGPPQKTDTSKKKAAPKKVQSGTKDSPVFVEGQLTTTKSEYDADEEAAENDQKAEREWWAIRIAIAAALVAIGVLWVAIKQLGMFRSQLTFMRDGFRAAHFPKLILRRVRIPPVDEEPNGGIEIVLFNAGNADAHRITANVNIEAIDSSKCEQFERQALPQYKGVTINVSEHLSKPPRNREFLKAGERAIVYFPDPIVRKEWVSLGTRSKVLYFFGHVTFYDTGGTARDSGYFRIYDPGSGKFQPKDDPDYEWN